MELAAIENMVRSDPAGRTPLCSQLAQVTRAVKEEAARLQAAGQRCVVVVASGMPMMAGLICQIVGLICQFTRSLLTLYGSGVSSWSSGYGYGSRSHLIVGLIDYKAHLPIY